MANMTRKDTRRRIRYRIRRKVHGTAERPRLAVFRSIKHIYVQAIDDVAGRTLVHASSRDSEIKGEGNIEAAKKVLRDFIKAMHKWERQAAKAQKAAKSSREIEAEQLLLFGKFCVPKDPRFGRNGAFSDPPEYDPKTETIQQAEKIGHRIGILTARPPYGLRLYTMLKRDDRWWIDSAKSSAGGAFSLGTL